MTNSIKKYLGIILVLSIVSLSILGLLNSVKAATFTRLTSQLAVGSSGADVTNLQTFLASNTNIYPQGLITGYFGSLTKQAVINFQAAYGIAQVGAVGPITLAKINSLIESGVNLTGTSPNTGAPIIYSPAVNPLNTSAAITWSTNKPATAEVYYSTSPFQLAEAIGSEEPKIIGGTITPETTTLQTNQNISIQNLQPHTLYYYIIESTDASGNLQYTWPTTFTTTY